LDELARIRELLELYEAALEELRSLDDPALEELEVRLEARAAVAAHEYYERLEAHGATAGASGSWSSGIGGRDAGTGARAA